MKAPPAGLATSCYCIFVSSGTILEVELTSNLDNLKEAGQLIISNNGTSLKQQIDFSISSVTERDIDLLLLEEFVATPAFSKWFNRQTADQDLAEEPVISAHRSVTTSSGESDLEIVMLSSDDRVHKI